MKVRVKEDKSGFIYGRMVTEGDVITLKPIEHSNETDEKGKPLVISVDQQFSKNWMEKVKRGPKPKD